MGIGKNSSSQGMLHNMDALVVGNVMDRLVNGRKDIHGI